tara:strand:- start:370 stop:540 length:171 start_codon:yes stop_codon:yes gene_type:complete
MTLEIEMGLKAYEQRISSFKVIFYDMDGEEIDIDLPEWAYNDLNEAVYEWETENGE